MTELFPLQEAAASLLVYRSLLDQPVGRAWMELVRVVADGGGPSNATPARQLAVLEAYGDLFAALASVGQTWSDWLLSEVLVADNPFAQVAARMPWEEIPAAAIEAARHDLRCLQMLWGGEAMVVRAVERLTSRSPAIWQPQKQTEEDLEEILAEASDWGTCVGDLARRYRREGIGLLGRYRAARWQAGGLQGVATPDPIALDHLYGCDRQKMLLCQNTEALLARQPALNVLLYGARGTGKSSLVKALLQRYGSEGLRLVELSRAELSDLLDVVAALGQLPQSFILFVDDLSFEVDERDFKQLKAMLEGDIAAQPPNVRLYATSNRRHLVAEYFDDRPNPTDREVHAWDTVQEKLSLSDRFGLTLTFLPFTQADYFGTVHHLAEVFRLPIEPEFLQREALVWAQQQNGFSGRTARQFIDRRRGLVSLGMAGTV